MLGKVGGQSDRLGTWEPGSGDASGDCDDEDGCQGSGEGDLKEDNIIAKTGEYLPCILSTGPAAIFKLSGLQGS
ncbi:UNVERIFIED_CONTAM: hypothetical protein FKN15_012474 [Acipenser sinensis]